MLITVSGLDGAGKSTLIQWLRVVLERDGHAVAVCHMNDDVGVYAYTRAARDWLLRRLGRDAPRRHPAPLEAASGPLVGTPWRRVLRRLRNALVWSTALRACIYPIDLLIFAGYRLYLERARKRILVMDRYFYDTLVDLSVDGWRRWHGWLERLTPIPDLPVLLDVPPSQAFERKNEYPVAYLERRWTAYQTVLSRVPSCVRLPNTEAAPARGWLWRVVRSRMGDQLGRRSPWSATLRDANGQGR